MNKRGINYTVGFFLIPFLKRHLQETFILRNACRITQWYDKTHVRGIDEAIWAKDREQSRRRGEETQLKQGWLWA